MKKIALSFCFWLSTMLGFTACAFLGRAGLSAIYHAEELSYWKETYRAGQNEYFGGMLSVVVAVIIALFLAVAHNAMISYEYENTTQDDKEEKAWREFKSALFFIYFVFVSIIWASSRSNEEWWFKHTLFFDNGEHYCFRGIHLRGYWCDHMLLSAGFGIIMVVFVSIMLMLLFITWRSNLSSKQPKSAKPDCKELPSGLKGTP